MAIAAIVRTYTGERIASSIDVSFNSMVEMAVLAELHLLANVDPYDDTVFNRSQVGTLVREVALLRRLHPDQEADAIRELGRLANLVEEKPHRYLVFVGD